MTVFQVYLLVTLNGVISLPFIGLRSKLWFLGLVLLNKPPLSCTKDSSVTESYFCIYFFLSTFFKYICCYSLCITIYHYHLKFPNFKNLNWLTFKENLYLQFLYCPHTMQWILDKPMCSSMRFSTLKVFYLEIGN